MRNFKKLLSLVLCMAVMLSVMVVGAGAAFSDQSKIENTEAVDVCSTLDIINGYTDGSFKPEGTITRAEMCKMICVALNGGKDPVLGTSATSSFTDTKGHWAEGYIESCVTQGIVAGVGGGKFNPNGNVTGSQAAKMLLTALGFKSDVEKFTGDAWEVNVNVRATQKDLYDGLESMDVSAALTRDNAAQMIWNTLQAKMVSYKNEFSTVNGQLVATQVLADKTDINGKTVTMLKDKYNADTDVGTLVSINKDSLAITISATDAVDSYHGAGDNPIFTKLDKDYSSLLGQKVRVLFKAGKTNSVFGVYADSDNTSYTVNASDIENDKGDLKFGGKTHTVELTSGKLDTYVDGNSGTNLTVAQLVAMNNTANVLTLIDTNGNDKIDTVYVKTVNVEKVTYASSSQIVAGGKTYKYADENIVSGVKKDDWVVITENKFNDNKDITLAEKVTNVTLQGTKGTSPAYTDIRIDGTWYYVAAGKSFSDIKAGNTADVVVVNGVLFDAKKISGSGAGMPDVLMVLATGSGLDSNKIKFILPDGTIKTEEYSGIAPSVGVVYAWEMDGAKYKLSALSASADTDDYDWVGSTNNHLKNANLVANWSTGCTSYVGATGDISGGGTKVEISDSAKVIIGYGSDSKVVTGKQFKNLTYGAGINETVAAAYTSKVDGLTRVSLLYVTATSEPSGFNTNDNYGYVVSNAYASGDSYYTFDMWDGANNVTVKSKNSGIKAGDIIGYSSIDDNGKINDVKNYGDAQSGSPDLKLGSITGVNSKKDGIVFEGQSDYFNITKDTVILYVDSKNSDSDKIGVAGDKTAIDSYVLEDNAGVYAYNVKYVMDGAEDVAVMVVDVLGDMKLAAADMYAITDTSITTATAISSGYVVDEDGNTVTTAAKGDVLTIKLTGTATGAFKLTITGGVDAQGNAVTNKNLTVGADGTCEFEFIATGAVTIATA